ncbi:MAG: PKD domain-containing protein [Nonlabens sp.]
MRNIYKILVFCLLATGVSCQEDDVEFGPIITPTSLSVDFERAGEDVANPNGDGSGNVVFQASADNATNYIFDFGDGRTAFSADGRVEHRFVQLGVNTYSVTVTATGTGGVSTTETILVEVLSTFQDDAAVQFLTGGSSKTWYWSVAEDAHWGVGAASPATIPGQSSYADPTFFPAPAFARYCFDAADATCFYEDEMTFTKVGNNVMFELENFGNSYIHNSYFNDFGGPPAGNDGSTDACVPFPTPAPGMVTFLPVVDSAVPEDRSTGTSIILGNDNFLSWYVGSSEYEILEISENRVVFRTIQANDTVLAWYHVLTTDIPVNPNPSCI